MNFGEAFLEMKNGKGIRRSDWHESLVMRITPSANVIPSGMCSLRECEHTSCECGECEKSLYSHLEELGLEIGSTEMITISNHLVTHIWQINHDDVTADNWEVVFS